jgi:hypothetical protein
MTTTPPAFPAILLAVASLLFPPAHARKVTLLEAQSIAVASAPSAALALDDDATDNPRLKPLPPEARLHYIDYDDDHQPLLYVFNLVDPRSQQPRGFKVIAADDGVHDLIMTEAPDGQILGLPHQWGSFAVVFDRLASQVKAIRQDPRNARLYAPILHQGTTFPDNSAPLRAATAPLRGATKVRVADKLNLKELPRFHTGPPYSWAWEEVPGMKAWVDTMVSFFCTKYLRMPELVRPDLPETVVAAAKYLATYKRLIPVIENTVEVVNGIHTQGVRFLPKEGFFKSHEAYKEFLPNLQQREQERKHLHTYEKPLAFLLMRLLIAGNYRPFRRGFFDSNKSEYTKDAYLFADQNKDISYNFKLLSPYVLRKNRFMASDLTPRESFDLTMNHYLKSLQSYQIKKKPHLTDWFYLNDDDVPTTIKNSTDFKNLKNTTQLFAEIIRGIHATKFFFKAENTVDRKGNISLVDSTAHTWPTVPEDYFIELISYFVAFTQASPLSINWPLSNKLHTLPLHEYSFKRTEGITSLHTIKEDLKNIENAFVDDIDNGRMPQVMLDYEWLTRNKAYGTNNIRVHKDVSLAYIHFDVQSLRIDRVPVNNMIAEGYLSTTYINHEGSYVAFYFDCLNKFVTGTPLLSLANLRDPFREGSDSKRLSGSSGDRSFDNLFTQLLPYYHPKMYRVPFTDTFGDQYLTGLDWTNKGKAPKESGVKGFDGHYLAYSAHYILRSPKVQKRHKQEGKSMGIPLNDRTHYGRPFRFVGSFVVDDEDDNGYPVDIELHEPFNELHRGIDAQKNAMRNLRYKLQLRGDLLRLENPNGSPVEVAIGVFDRDNSLKSIHVLDPNDIQCAHWNNGKAQIVKFARDIKNTFDDLLPGDFLALLSFENTGKTGRYYRAYTTSDAFKSTWGNVSLAKIPFFQGDPNVENLPAYSIHLFNPIKRQYLGTASSTKNSDYGMPVHTIRFENEGSRRKKSSRRGGADRLSNIGYFAVNSLFPFRVLSSLTKSEQNRDKHWYQLSFYDSGSKTWKNFQPDTLFNRRRVIFRIKVHTNPHHSPRAGKINIRSYGFGASFYDLDHAIRHRVENNAYLTVFQYGINKISITNLNAGQNKKNLQGATKGKQVKAFKSLPAPKPPLLGINSRQPWRIFIHEEPKRKQTAVLTGGPGYKTAKLGNSTHNNKHHTLPSAFKSLQAITSYLGLPEHESVILDERNRTRSNYHDFWFDGNLEDTHKQFQNSTVGELQFDTHYEKVDSLTMADYTTKNGKITSVTYHNPYIFTQKNHLNGLDIKTFSSNDTLHFAFLDDTRITQLKKNRNNQIPANGERHRHRHGEKNKKFSKIRIETDKNGNPITSHLHQAASKSVHKVHHRHRKTQPRGDNHSKMVKKLPDPQDINNNANNYLEKNDKNKKISSLPPTLPPKTSFLPLQTSFTPPLLSFLRRQEPVNPPMSLSPLLSSLSPLSLRAVIPATAGLRSDDKEDEDDDEWWEDTDWAPEDDEPLLDENGREFEWQDIISLSDYDDEPSGFTEVDERHSDTEELLLLTPDVDDVPPDESFVLQPDTLFGPIEEIDDIHHPVWDDDFEDDDDDEDETFVPQLDEAFPEDDLDDPDAINQDNPLWGDDPEEYELTQEGLTYLASLDTSLIQDATDEELAGLDEAFPEDDLEPETETPEPLPDDFFYDEDSPEFEEDPDDDDVYVFDIEFQDMDDPTSHDHVFARSTTIVVEARDEDGNAYQDLTPTDLPFLQLYDLFLFSSANNNNPDSLLFTHRDSTQSLTVSAFADWTLSLSQQDSAWIKVETLSQDDRRDTLLGIPDQDDPDVLNLFANTRQYRISLQLDDQDTASTKTACLHFHPDTSNIFLQDTFLKIVYQPPPALQVDPDTVTLSPQSDASAKVAVSAAKPWDWEWKDDEPDWLNVERLDQAIDESNPTSGNSPPQEQDPLPYQGELTFSSKKVNSEKDDRKADLRVYIRSHDDEEDTQQYEEIVTVIQEGVYLEVSPQSFTFRDSETGSKEATVKASVAWELDDEPDQWLSLRTQGDGQSSSLDDNHDGSITLTVNEKYKGPDDSRSTDFSVRIQDQDLRQGREPVSVSVTQNKTKPYLRLSTYLISTDKDGTTQSVSIDTDSDDGYSTSVSGSFISVTENSSDMSVEVSSYQQQGQRTGTVTARLKEDNSVSATLSVMQTGKDDDDDDDDDDDPDPDDGGGGDGGGNGGGGGDGLSLGEKIALWVAGVVGLLIQVAALIAGIAALMNSTAGAFSGASGLIIGLILGGLLAIFLALFLSLRDDGNGAASNDGFYIHAPTQIVWNAASHDTVFQITTNCPDLWTLQNPKQFSIHFNQAAVDGNVRTINVSLSAPPVNEYNMETILFVGSKETRSRNMEVSHSFSLIRADDIAFNSYLRLKSPSILPIANDSVVYYVYVPHSGGTFPLDIEASERWEYAPVQTNAPETNIDLVLYRRSESKPVGIGAFGSLYRIGEHAFEQLYLAVEPSPYINERENLLIFTLKEENPNKMIAVIVRQEGLVSRKEHNPFSTPRTIGTDDFIYDNDDDNNNLTHTPETISIYSLLGTLLYQGPKPSLHELKDHIPLHFRTQPLILTSSLGHSSIFILQ